MKIHSKIQYIALVLTLSAGVTAAQAPSKSGDRPYGEKKEMRGDANGDGVVSKSEFLDQAEKRFSKIDANGDGQITREEGRAARKEHRQNRREKMAKWRKDKLSGE